MTSCSTHRLVENHLRSQTSWGIWCHFSRSPRRTVHLLTALLVAGAVLLAGLPSQVRAQTEQTIHVILPGESLAGIAKLYNIALADLQAANRIDNPNHIVIGAQLQIPMPDVERPVAAADPAQLPGNGGYYLVQRGDSLSQIAKWFGLTQEDLLRLNGLDNAHTIFVGQTLRLTARVDPVAAQMSVRADAVDGPADAIYIVQVGDTLAQIAQDHGTTVEQLMVTNGLPNAGFVWSGQRLRIRQPASPAATFGVAGAPENGKRWIEIDLSAQTLTAWQGDVPVLHTVVSTGKSSTPTVTGRFATYVKYESQHMTGPGYDLPGVPWVMYFYQDYGIHGAYWHNNFGVPVSHGCVNMRIDEAKALYEWAGVGTEVVVHE